MAFTAEHVAAAHQANLNAAADLGKSAMQGFERVLELNLAAGKAAVNESFATAQALLSAKTPQDLLAIQTALVQPAFEKSVSYGRHLYEIASSSSAEFTQALEAKVAEGQATAKNVIEANLKNAPAGSEAAVAAFRTAFDASQAAAATLQKAAKQATESTQANLKAATAQAEAALKSTLKAAKAK